ncbi:hypothetical protein [Streptomyces sp. NPDC002132]|uniref:hypothetical protein n=1 Tax=unclassified Streptomyces TaxID=2593676 RepID=UPI003319C19D
MTRRTALWLLYWLTILAVASVASLAAALPFTGGTATAAGITVSALVCLAGMALEPRGGRGSR